MENHTRAIRARVSTGSNIVAIQDPATGEPSDALDQDQADNLLDMMPEDGASFLGSLNEFEQIVGECDFTNSDTALTFIPETAELMATMDKSTFDSLQVVATRSGVQEDEDECSEVKDAGQTDQPVPKPTAKATMLPASKSRGKAIVTPIVRVTPAAESLPVGESSTVRSSAPTAAANRMDACSMAMNQKQSNQIPTFILSCELLDDEFENSGFYPGLEMTLDDRCMTSNMDLNKFMGTKSHYIKVEKVHHTLRCVQDKAWADELPELQAIYNAAASSGFQMLFLPGQ